MSVVQKAPDTMTIAAAATYVAACSAVTTSMVPDAAAIVAKVAIKQAFAIDDIRNSSHQEPKQHVGDHA